MKGRSVVILLFAVAATGGCGIVSNSVPGSGTPATETREIDAFEEISLAGTGDFHIKCGQPPSLSITTDDNLLELIETRVQAGDLRIKVQNISPTVGPDFDVTAETLSNISIAGSADVSVTACEGDQLQLSIAGSGSFKVSGVVRTVSLEIAGSGDADLTELMADEVSIEIAGSGEARVHANEKLSARIAGSGDISYVGDPTIQKSIVGSGSVKKLN